MSNNNTNINLESAPVFALAVVQNSKGEILTIQRWRNPSHYGFPGGLIDWVAPDQDAMPDIVHNNDGTISFIESARCAAEREFFEEVGIALEGIPVNVYVGPARVGSTKVGVSFLYQTDDNFNTAVPNMGAEGAKILWSVPSEHLTRSEYPQHDETMLKYFGIL
jgi:8-oxo-dGTP pyrophosphatase MutT (NUDIX family)